MNQPSDDSSYENDKTEQFVALLMGHRHRLYAFIAKQLVNPADVEDVFQKTSIVLWKKMEQFDVSKSFFHWSCGIAVNEVRNFLKTSKRGAIHFDPMLIDLIAEESIDEGTLTEHRLAALRLCIQELSQRQQQIVRRCYLGTESITDVADQMGRQRGALYKQLARLKGKLSDCIRLRVKLEGAGA